MESTAGESADGAWPGMIVRERQPENLEFPFSTLDAFITPTERFFVRSHSAVPEVDAGSWRLRIEGAVERPFDVGLDDLRELPRRSVTATLECAGNSRIHLVPKVKGVQWDMGAVGTAEWSGVPLAVLLERAGATPRAVEVVLEGSDRGEVSDDPKTPGEIPFARSVPLAKAREPDVLIALGMNGEELAPAHGFPARAMVPGWYGVASVKWLARLVIVERPFHGYYQSFDYSYWDRRHGLAALRPIQRGEVKSAIARPLRGQRIRAGEETTIRGAAWSGESPVTRVEVSVDGGGTWGEARFLDPANPLAWRRWEYPWRPERPGRTSLIARATDADGRVQPLQRDTDRRTYMIHHVLPVEVEVIARRDGVME